MGGRGCLTMPYMKSITVRFPEPLSRELKKMSRAKHQPVSDLVRDAVRRQMALERLQEIRSEVRPYAVKAGYLTEEDILGIPS
jgi:metal-responsive CopG/Arc/MetJ family transcriptional regulator